jgi:hypothetical protein
MPLGLLSAFCRGDDPVRPRSIISLGGGATDLSLVGVILRINEAVMSAMSWVEASLRVGR